MIFKRKSFRRFDDKLLISKSELKEITLRQAVSKPCRHYPALGHRERQEKRPARLQLQGGRELMKDELEKLMDSIAARKP